MNYAGESFYVPFVASQCVPFASIPQSSPVCNDILWHLQSPIQPLPCIISLEQGRTATLSDSHAEQTWGDHSRGCWVNENPVNRQKVPFADAFTPLNNYRPQQNTPRHWRKAETYKETQTTGEVHDQANNRITKINKKTQPNALVDPSMDEIATEFTERLQLSANDPKPDNFGGNGKLPQRKQRKLQKSQKGTISAHLLSAAKAPCPVNSHPLSKPGKTNEAKLESGIASPAVTEQTLNLKAAAAPQSTHKSDPASSSPPRRQISWASVASGPPKPRIQAPPTELRVLKRSEPIPTSNTENAAAPPRPTRAQKKALRAQNGAQIRSKKLKRLIPAEVTKTSLLSRFRSALAETTASARRGKERLIPKAKRLSVLKRGIVIDRQVRQMLRAQLTTITTPLPSTAVVAEPSTIRIALPRIPSLDEQIVQLLTLLAEFHDRAYKQTVGMPAKRMSSRRLVCGFHEVIKSLKLNRLKFLIVAIDLEKGAYEISAESTTEGPQDQPRRTEALAKTLALAVQLAREKDCPAVLAFKRRYLQKLCHKRAPVGCVGILNFAGAEDKAKLLVGAWREAMTST